MARSNPKAKAGSRKMEQPAGPHGEAPNPGIKSSGKGMDSGTGAKSVSMPGGSTGNRGGKKK